MRVIVFNKPVGVLTRFTDQQDRPNLSHYLEMPEVYPVGRLDKDSEGLLLLTDEGRLVKPLLTPGAKRKTYLVCVEGQPKNADLTPLREGLVLKDGPCRPAQAKLVAEPDWLWPRDPPIRYRKSVPTSWLEITITEGRNRQVRRMTAAVGFPTLRLVRTRFGPVALKGLGCGEWRAADSAELGALKALIKTGKKRRRRG